MRKINIIEPKVPQMPSRKKVAAYARVSMESERLMRRRRIIIPNKHFNSSRCIRDYSLNNAIMI